MVWGGGGRVKSGGNGRGGGGEELRLPYATLNYSMVLLPLHSTTMTALGKKLKGQYHAIFSNTLKLEKMLFG